MAVFLTKNAPGLRTSPVKRGLLGGPPRSGRAHPRAARPGARAARATSANMGNLTLREVLAQHRENEACSGCHARFDSFGLAFEGYGPVGETPHGGPGRTAGGQRARPFGAGSAGRPRATAWHGLRAHLRAHRQDDFLDNLGRKLLSYALGRGLMLSDESTITKMQTRLAAEGYRFSALVDSIVTSPQFLTRRAGDYSASRVE